MERRSPTSPSIAILIVAGGRGSRAGDGLPKQYRPIAGKTRARPHAAWAA